MFDFSAWEILLVVIVALIILGPTRLPVAAQAVGRMVGSIKHMFHRAKDEMEEQEKQWTYEKNLKKAQQAEKQHEPNKQ